MNKVILVGNVGRDAELSYLKDDLAKLSFSVATTEHMKDKKITEWHNIVMFGKRAEKLAQYITKGCQVIIDGRITNRSWDGKDGKKHYRTEIICNEFEFSGNPKKEYNNITEVASDVTPALDKDYVVGTDTLFTANEIPF